MGGNVTYSLAGDYLQYGLSDDYGPAVRRIEATAYFRGWRVRDPSLQRRYDEFHAVQLPALPRVRFLAKKARMTLEYETKVVDATFLERYGVHSLSAGVFSRVVGELGEQLHLIDPKLGRARGDFDLERFHRDVAALTAAVPTTDQALRDLHVRLEAAERERYAAMDAWEKLDIDWDDYHPAARQLLDDPFLWSCIDDDAPHGNDTGADLLADFKRWNRTHPDRPAHELASRLLKAWEMPGLDLERSDAESTRAMFEADRIALSVTDQSLIAAAFAAVKCRGCCDAVTRELALRAIEREKHVTPLYLKDALEGAAWNERLDWLAGILRRVPER